jgi:hypothetical protein
VACAFHVTPHGAAGDPQGRVCVESRHQGRQIPRLPPVVVVEHGEMATFGAVQQRDVVEPVAQPRLVVGVHDALVAESLDQRTKLPCLVSDNHLDVIEVLGQHTPQGSAERLGSP